MRLKTINSRCVKGAKTDWCWSPIRSRWCGDWSGCSETPVGRTRCQLSHCRTASAPRTSSGASVKRWWTTGESNRSTIQTLLSKSHKRHKEKRGKGVMIYQCWMRKEELKTAAVQHRRTLTVSITSHLHMTVSVHLFGHRQRLQYIFHMHVVSMSSERKKAPTLPCSLSQFVSELQHNITAGLGSRPPALLKPSISRVTRTHHCKRLLLC